MRYVVEIAEIKIARAPDTLVCIGIGSCVVVTLYDREKRIGGMTHALLPFSNGFSTEPKKFVDQSINNLLELMLKEGARKDHIVSKIVGGACIFPGLNEIRAIGERNILAGKRTLLSLGIPIVGEDVGGDTGRSVEFKTETGEVIVRTGKSIKCII